MAQAAWGTKRRCSSCGAGFYDLNKDPIICPKCDAAYQPGQQRRRPAPLPPLRGRVRHTEIEEPEQQEEVVEAEAEADTDSEEEGRGWSDEESEDARDDKGY